MRVLVTGSRNWGNPDAVARAMLKIIPPDARESVTVVHGGCPTGADAIADAIAREHGWRLEVHPARWKAEGRAAGPLRNQRMVDAGADICLAFPLGESRGTRDCIRRAVASGINTEVANA